MSAKKRIALSALIFAMLVLSACSSTPPVKKVTLVATDIAWNLQTIEAKVGQPVEITVRNDGALDHDLVIEELGVDLLLNPGDQQLVTFTLDEPATFDFICSIPGHEEAGMAGKIIVTE